MKKTLCVLLVALQLLLPAANAFAAQIHRVCFVDYDGAYLLSEPYYQTVADGAAAVAPKEPQREGYRFAGWDADFSAVKGDLTVTALYEALTCHTYRIDYKLFDGGLAAQPYVAVTPAGAPFSASVPTPSVAGYKLRNDEQESVVFDEENVSGDVAVTVWYDPADDVKYTVEYRLETLDKKYDVKTDAGYESTAPTGSTVTAQKKKFEGFSAPAEMPSAKVAADGSTALAALYTRNMYTTYYITGASAMSPKVYLFGETTTAPAEPTRRGYDFVGWYEDEGLSVPHSFGAMPARDVTLYARWRAAQSSYTVAYLLESENGKDFDYALSEKKSALTDSSIAPSAYGRGFDGFTFSQKDSDTVTVSGDGATVQYIRFLRKTVSVTFMTKLNGQYRKAGSFTGKFGESILDKWFTTSPTKDYSRWSERQDGSSPWYSSLAHLPDKDLTLYAVDDGDKLWQIFYYLEALPGEEHELVSAGKRYNEKTGTPVKIYFDGRELSITENEDCYPIDGFTFLRYDDFGRDRKAEIYYTRNSYRIDFLLNGANGTPPKPIEALYGSKLTRPADPEAYEGFDFDGWFTTADGYEGSEFDFTDALMPAENMVLFAKWTPKTYTVSFDLNGAEDAIDPVSGVKSGSKIALPDDPARTGYSFAFWTLDGSMFTADSVVTKDITLTAHWIPADDLECVVHFVLKDDPTTEVHDDVHDGGHRAGETVVENAFVVDGLLPDYHSKSRTLTGDAAEDEVTFFYVPFNEAEYFVRYLDENGAALLEEKRKTTSNNVVTESFVPINGYYPDAYQKTAALASNENDIITFNYTANAASSYTVRHYKQNVSGVGYTLDEETTHQSSVGSTVNVPTKTYEGFAYNDALSYRSGLVATGDATVFRLYYDRLRYDVSFFADANGSLDAAGSFDGIPHETEWGDAVSAPSPVPDRGYRFSRWLPSDPAAIAASYKITSDMSFTAYFEYDPSQWFTVSYDANGGVGTMSSDAGILAGSDYTLKQNAFTLDDNDFAGWAVSPTGEIAYPEGGIIENISSDITLYAVYTPRPRATITYYPNGGTGASRTDRPVSGTPYTILSNAVTGFSRQGYDFLNWNTAPNGSGTSYAAGASISAVSLNLYAQWSRDPNSWVTVSFNKNDPAATGSMSPLTVLSGTTATLPANGFSLANNKFLGWATSASGPAVYANGATTGALTSNLALYAVWEQDESFTVVYNGNGATSGSTVDPRSPYFSGNVTVLQNGFVRTGAVFLGWSETPLPLVTTKAQADALTLIQPGFEIIDISEDYVFYAVWASENYDKYTVTYFGNGNTGGTAPIDMSYYALGSLVTAKGSGDLVRAGYYFAGWLVNNGTLVKPGETVIVTGDMTFTAQWVRNEDHRNPPTSAGAYLKR